MRQELVPNTRAHAQYWASNITDSEGVIVGDYEDFAALSSITS